MKSNTNVTLPVRIGDINYGNHLGHVEMVGLLHEARIQWLASWGWSERQCEGIAMVVRSLHIRYIAECFYGDVLSFDMTATRISACRFRIRYHVTRGQQAVAEAEVEMVCIHPDTRKIVRIPDPMSHWMACE